MSNEVDPKARLRDLAIRHGSQVAAATAIGVSPAYFSDLLAGKRNASARILRLLGLRRSVVADEGKPRKART